MNSFSRQYREEPYGAHRGRRGSFLRTPFRKEGTYDLEVTCGKSRKNEDWEEEGFWTGSAASGFHCLCKTQFPHLALSLELIQ